MLSLGKFSAAAAGWSLTAMILASAAAGPALAEVERLSVVLHGEAVGVLSGDTEGDTTKVAFAWQSNGRGPDLAEVVKLDANGLPVDWSVKGVAMMGGQVGETYTLRKGHAVWKSQAEKGDVRVTKPTMYVPNDGSPWALGVYTRALLKAPGNRLAVLPGGTMTLTKVRDMTMSEGGKAVPLSVYRLDGIQISPDYVLLDEQQRMFAHISLRGTGIREGYEASIGELQKLNADLEGERVRQISREVTHRFGTAIRIRNVHVFDPRTGTTGPLSTVVVMRDKITRVLPQTEDVAADAADETVVDGQGGYLIPGLHDMHSHAALDTGLFQIAAGITSTRDMGNYNGFFLDLHPRVDSGEITGPRMTPSGILEGHSQYALNMGFKPNSLDEAMSQVRWYADHGYAMVKFYSSFNPDWVKPLSAEAHRLGMKAGGHVPAFTSTDRMVEDGYDNLVHMNQVAFSWMLDPKDDTRTLLRVTGMKNAADLDLNSPTIQKTVELMKAHNTSIDPTIMIIERLMMNRAQTVGPGDVDYLDHMPIGLQRQRKRTNVTLADAAEDQTYRKAFAKTLQMVKMFHDAGVQVLPGTDDATGFGLHREIELYAVSGMTPAVALRLATLDSETYLGGADHLGTLDVGKLADLVLLADDPTKDIRAIKRPRMVMKGGDVFFPNEIYDRLGIKSFASPPPVTKPAK